MIDDYPILLASQQLSQLVVQRICATGSMTDHDDIESAIELDSHVNSPVVGRVPRVIERKGMYVSVSGFTNKLGKPIHVPVVDAAVSYMCDKTGKSMIMIIRNALHIPEMEACLLHPIMMRLANIQVNECPKFLSNNPTESNHSLYFPEYDL